MSFPVQRYIDGRAQTRALLEELNAASARVRSKHEFFEETCRIAIEIGGFEFAWIGTIDLFEKHITPVAWKGVAAECLDVLGFSSLVYGKMHEASGLAIRAALESKSFFINDAQVDSVGAETALHRYNHRVSVAVLPLSVSKEVVAVICLVAIKPGFFDEERSKLTAELAGNIEFALQTFNDQEKLMYLGLYNTPPC